MAKKATKNKAAAKEVKKVSPAAAEEKVAEVEKVTEIKTTEEKPDRSAGKGTDDFPGYGCL